MIYAWAIVPYIIALSLFILPVTEIHKSIKREKINRLDKLRVNRQRLRAEITRLDSQPNVVHQRQREALFSEYERVREEGGRLLALNTWPFNLKQVCQFVTTLIVPAAIVILRILQKSGSG